MFLSSHPLFAAVHCDTHRSLALIYVVDVVLKIMLVRLHGTSRKRLSVSSSSYLLTGNVSCAECRYTLRRDR